MKKIKQLLARLIGDKNTLSNNVLFIDYTQSHEKAQFLSQLFYWSQRTKMKDGFFAKSYDEWFEEIRIKKQSLRRYAREFQEKGLLEIKFKKFNDVPTLHYKLNADKLINELMEFAEGINQIPTPEGITVIPSEGDTVIPSQEGDTVIPSINRDYQRLLTENTGEFPPNGEHEILDPPKQPEKKKKKKVAPKKKSPTRFAPPTLTEVIDYFFEKESEQAILFSTEAVECEAGKFFNYYESNGWMVGRNKMKKWKSAASGWILRAKQYNNGKGNHAEEPERIGAATVETHRRVAAMWAAEGDKW